MKATLIEQEKEVMVKQIQKIPIGINLPLTFEEAQLIVDIMSNFDGYPVSTTRQYSQQIFDKLSTYLKYNNRRSGSCYFTSDNYGLSGVNLYCISSPNQIL